jgi:hypothetical protein
VQSLLIKGSAPLDTERKLERAHAPAANIAIVAYVAKVLRLVPGVVNDSFAAESADLHR